jgi:hypothetical protein
MELRYDVGGLRDITLGGCLLAPLYKATSTSGEQGIELSNPKLTKLLIVTADYFNTSNSPLSFALFMPFG